MGKLAYGCAITPKQECVDSLPRSKIHAPFLRITRKYCQPLANLSLYVSLHGSHIDRWYYGFVPGTLIIGWLLLSPPFHKLNFFQSMGKPQAAAPTILLLLFTAQSQQSQQGTYAHKLAAIVLAQSWRHPETQTTNIRTYTRTYLTHALYLWFSVFIL